MYSKNIFIFLILGLISITKIYGMVGKCNDIYEYLDSQGISESLYDCEVNEKEEVIELKIYASCFTNEQLKTVLSYNTIETLEIDIIDRSSLNYGCNSYPTNYEIFNTLTNLKSFSLVGANGFLINVLPNISKQLKMLQIGGKDFSEDLNLTQDLVDSLSELSNLNSLKFTNTIFSKKIDYSKFENLKKLTFLEIEFDFNNPDYIQENLLKYCNSLKKLVISDGIFNEKSFNAISNLANLEELELEYYEFEEGAVFSSINKLKNLKTLSLTCPLAIGFNKHDLSSNLFYLTKLKRFSIRNCSITFTPLKNSPSWSNLKNLEYLRIYTSDDEYRDDAFDYKYLGDIPSLKEVYINGKGYSNITENIGNLKNLEILDLSYNSIDSLPKAIGGLEKLRELNLHSNDLISIPEEIGNLKNLKDFRITFNELTSLPESIGNLYNLERFWASYNYIINIPESIGNLSKLTYLELNKNQITEIPKSIGDLMIDSLNFESNNIERIPDEVGNMKNLIKINLNINNIASIPSSLKNLENLEYLYLRENQIERIPDWIGEMKNLKSIDLYRNKITNIPSSLGNLNKLQNLNLSSNLIDDYLPESLNNLPNLQSIELAGNINIKRKTLTNPSLK